MATGISNVARVAFPDGQKPLSMMFRWTEERSDVGAGPMRRLVAATAVCAATLTLSSCVDSRTDPPPQPVKVTAQDMYGKWSGWEGSSLTLAPDAKAWTEVWVPKPPGIQLRRFLENDRHGHLECAETGCISRRKHRGHRVGDPPGGEPHTVRQGERATFPVSHAAPSPNPTVAAFRTELPPDRATWDIGVTKGQKGELLLVFLTSDPDVRDRYYLTKDGTGAL